jgi:hypothetical protein
MLKLGDMATDADVFIIKEENSKVVKCRKSGQRETLKCIKRCRSSTIRHAVMNLGSTSEGFVCVCYS